MKQLSILLIICILLFSACQRILLNAFGVLDKTVTMRRIKNSEKEILFIPMHHVGKKDFYDDVKNKIDSLRGLGFIFYYEGVKRTLSGDSLSNDTIRRKLRKIIWIDVLSPKMKTGYIDSLGNTTVGISNKNIKRYDLVNQPGRTKLGIDSLNDKWVDVYISDLLEAFEKKFGRLELSECDLKSGYDTKYTCEKYKNKEGRKFVLTDYRNQVIADQILKDTHTKIAIIYGAKHFDGILKELQQKDSTWKLVDMK